ncbi:MAG: toll/interleukin-1 receptor domain-containing protein [Planctomycetia bacterium]|nr:toll/interleukin-1 receptor domain-containing protein [Planctomycetia bacterium]
MAKAIQKQILFISHVAEEIAIGKAFEKLIDETFMGLMKPFVSDIPLGLQWYETISKNLKDCSAGVVMVGPRSVRRPWINWESGAIWGQGKKIIPLCHSGLIPTKLPYPLQGLQAGIATDAESLNLVLSVVAQCLGCNMRTVNVQPFIDAVKAFEIDDAKNNLLIKNEGSTDVDGMGKHEVDIMSALLTNLDNPEAAVPTDEIYKVATSMGHSRNAITLGLGMLKRRGLIEFADHGNYSNDVWFVTKPTPDGWEWLYSNSHLFIMTAEPEPAAKTNDDGPPLRRPGISPIREKPIRRPPVDDGDIPF